MAKEARNILSQLCPDHIQLNQQVSDGDRNSSFKGKYLKPFYWSPDEQSCLWPVIELAVVLVSCCGDAKLSALATIIINLHFFFTFFTSVED